MLIDVDHLLQLARMSGLAPKCELPYEPNVGSTHDRLQPRWIAERALWSEATEGGVNTNQGPRHPHKWDLQCLLSNTLGSANNVTFSIMYLGVEGCWTNHQCMSRMRSQKILDLGSFKPQYADKMHGHSAPQWQMPLRWLPTIKLHNNLGQRQVK